MSTIATFGISAPMRNTPLFTGTSATSSEVPGLFHVALNGRGFLLDLASNEYRRVSIPLLRQQADQSEQPGEASINPDDLWRRTATTWHKGAGQRILDGGDDVSVPGRFYTSKGIDPWTKGQLSLLPDTDEKKSSANTNLALAVAGGYLYLIDGTSIQYTQDVTVDSPTWTDITGEPATAPTAITSDGNSVWTAHGADGIYLTTRGAASTASSITGTVAGVKYLKGRLFAWSTDKLYNPTAAGALPAALYDHPNSDFAWVDMAEAGDFYYAAGYSGDKSLIYRTEVKADGTGLDVPVVAAELPDGEIIRSIQGYLGFILIGTDKGIRFGAPDGAGDITLGGLIEEALEVRCFEGQGPFVWFGWSQYDATSTGLGRLDLGTFNESRPAFASDLMCTENGDVLSIATFQGIRVFAVSADGIFAQHTDKVASGTIDLGRITYGLLDPKVSLYVTLNHEPLDGSLGVAMARDHGEYTDLGGESTTASSVRSDFPTNKARAQAFDLRITLTRDAVATVGPVVNSVTLRSYPSAARSERIVLPLLLNSDQRNGVGSSERRNVIDDLAYLTALEEGGTPFTLQEGLLTSVVVAEDHDFRVHAFDDASATFNGTYVITLKRFASE